MPSSEIKPSIQAPSLVASHRASFSSALWAALTLLWAVGCGAPPVVGQSPDDPPPPPVQRLRDGGGLDATSRLDASLDARAMLDVPTPMDGPRRDTGLMCPPANPGLDPELLPQCCGGNGSGRCLPAALVPASNAGMLGPCINGGLCVPDAIVRAGTSYVPRRCRSFGGLVGACVSRCIPMIQEQAMLLPRDICSADELCAPCYDPSMGNRSTGACEPTNACADASVPPPPPPITCPYNGPPIIDPTTLPACGCPGTRCMPTGRVPEEQRGRLATCPGGYCVPEPYIAAANNYVPRRCTAFGGLVGGCVSRCVPMVAEQAGILSRDVCGAEELCAPCFDPEHGNMPTGACQVPPNCGDGGFPPQPPPLRCPHMGADVLNPMLLPACPCAGSHCMPAARVPMGQRGMLAPCQGGYCVPDDFIRTANNYVPPTCAPFGGMGEGRCLSRCLPMVASQAGQLSQSTCSADKLCVPCFDPRTGMDTTACRQTCDPGPTQPPFMFPHCCSGRGTCVPIGNVPENQRDKLEARECPAMFLCAPNENLEMPPPAPQRCHAPGLLGLPGGPGVCISRCVKQTLLIRTLRQEDCSDPNYFCAPCRVAGVIPTGTPGC